MSAPELFEFSELRSRSVCAQNPSGAKGGSLKERRHYVKDIPVGETLTLADIEGPGMVRNIWLTVRDRDPESLRNFIIRIYWDDSEYPSVEAPLGDFFGLSHGRTAHYNTPIMGVSEGKGFWCYFKMPFSKRCRITFENDRPAGIEREEGRNSDQVDLFYQVMFTLGDKVKANDGRFHARFRRETPPIGSDYKIMSADGTPGVYIGTVLSALPQTAGTWREGDFRFFLDGDTDSPSIIGTGWSDWFLSAWGLGEHQSPYAGSNYQVLHPTLNNKYFCNSYRFHLQDPIYWSYNIRVAHSQVGEADEEWSLTSNRSDDWSSTAYWYQNVSKHAPEQFPDQAERSKGIEVQDWEFEALAKQRALTSQRNHNQMINLDFGG